MNETIKKIFNNRDFNELRAIYGQSPGILTTIFLDIASFGSNYQLKKSLYIMWTMISTSFILAYLTSPETFLISFLGYYSLMLILLFATSQIWLAQINFRSEKQYLKAINNLTITDKQKISAEILNKPLNNKFSDELRSFVFNYMKTNNFSETKENTYERVEPVFTNKI